MNRIYLGRTDIASILLNLTFEQMLDLGLRSKTSQKVCFFFGFLWRGPLVFLCREGLGRTPAVKSFWRPLAGCYMLHCSSVLVIVKIMTRNSWLQCPEGHLLTLLLRCISWGWCLHAQTLTTFRSQRIFLTLTWRACEIHFLTDFFFTTFMR